MRKAACLYVLSSSICLSMLAGCGGSQTPAVKPQANNPVPVISSLSPASSNAGAAAQTLTINGSGFMASSTATFNGEPATVAYTSSQQIAVALSASEQAAGGVFPVVVINPSPGGGSSQPANFTVNNPPPAVTSVSPGVIAVGSPAAEVTLAGTGFVPTSTATVGGAKLSTQYLSSTSLTATIPASDLSAAAALSVSVLNPSPKGGVAAGLPVAVVSVSGLAILAAPQTSGDNAGPWNVAVAAIDPSGAPIAGLEVIVAASSGSLTGALGTTDAQGGMSAVLTPPTGGTTITITAQTGAQSAGVVISLSAGTASAAMAARRRATANTRRLAAAQESPTAYFTEPVAFGATGGPGSPGFVTSTQAPACYSDAVLNGEETTPSDCQGTYNQDDVTQSAPNGLSLACSAVKTVSDYAGLANCIGAVALPVGCVVAAGATAGAAAAVCGGFLVVPEASMAAQCALFLAELWAQSQQNAGAQLGLASASYSLDIVACGAGDPVSCVGAGVGAVGMACDVPQPPAPTSGSPICAAGSTCIFVANEASSTISVFTPSGQPIPVASGQFPGLDEPDGLAYDPNTGYIYVTNLGNDTVTTYSPDGSEVTNTGAFPLPPTANPEDITFDPTDDEFYINDTNNGQILAFSESGQPISLPSGSFTGLSQPFGVFYDPLDTDIYVADSGTNLVTAYGASGDQIPLSGAFSGLSSPDDFVVDPMNQAMYVTEAEGLLGTCDVSGIAEFDLNGNALTPSGGFSTTDCPDSIALVPAVDSAGQGEELLYVTNIFGGSVTIYDQEGNDVTSEVAPGGFAGLSAPEGIIVVTVPATSPGGATRPSGSAPPSRSAAAGTRARRGGAQ